MSRFTRLSRMYRKGQSRESITRGNIMKTLIAGFLTMFHIVGSVAFGQVNEAWVQRFTSDSTRNEVVNDMFVDPQGNVYVTGSQRQTTANLDIQAVTVKYNSQGVQQWIQNFVDPAGHGASCRAIHVDGAGDVYVTGDNGIYGPPYEMLVIKYSSSGTQLWSYRFKYTDSGIDRGYDIITDATGNVYVCGEYGSTADFSVSLVKFGPSGNLINQTSYHNVHEGGRRIGLDGAGKIIVGGWHNNSTSLQFVALKYEQNLDFVWATRFGSGAPGNPYTTSPDMAIDINSNIILTGQNNLDYATTKLGPDGVVQWSRSYHYNISDVPTGVVTDNLGNIYVAGYIGGAGFPFSFDFCTIKYNPNGDEQWIRTLKPTYAPNGTDGFTGSDIALDNSANVYVTGSSYIGQNIVTAKYNTAGSLQWAKSYSGSTDNSGDYGVSVGVDASGNTYMAGNSNNNNYTTGNDIAIVKYAPVSLFTSKRIRSALNKPIVDNQQTLDSVTVGYTSPIDFQVVDVNVTIDSVIHPNVSDLEFVLMHEGITDTLIFQVGGAGQNFIGTVLNDSATTAIASGTAPFTGSFQPTRPLSQFNNANVNGDWTLGVYDAATGNTGTLHAWTLELTIMSNVTDIEDESEDIPGHFSLDQNYPNPFNPTTVISYRLPASSHVRLKIYSILGQEVATLVNGVQGAGYKQVEWNAGGVASGVYLYRIDAREEGSGQVSTVVKKMMLVR